MELQEFLTRYRFTEEQKQAVISDWPLLKGIYDDHVLRLRELEDAADFFVKSMQGFSGVHSVRWRVKDPEHLVEKIIRKRSAGNSEKKYLDISVDNYHEVISDLIGVRALHLFKDDCLEIHDQIIQRWDYGEQPVLYVRDGDRTELTDLLKEKNIKPKIHPAGYRSLHYVLKTKPGIREVLVEVQVRTVFEEAWSEIDHRVRYPSFSDNQQLENILKIFNRLAGSADEIGGFVKSLSSEFDLIGERISKADNERDNALDEIQKLVSQLTSAEETSSESASQASKLQDELDKLKAAIKTGEGTSVTPPGQSWIKVGGQSFLVSLPKKKPSYPRPPKPIRPLDV